MRSFCAFLVGLILLPAITGCAHRDPGAEPEYVEVVVGDPAPGQSVPLIFGIHGLGDSPEMFARLFASEFPIAARLVFPRGLSPEGQGFSWFPIPASAPIDGDAIADGVSAAGERIARLVERLTREHAPAVKPVVFGYSQGGMLSFYLAARHPDLIAAAVPLSGFLPPSLLGKSVPAPTHAFHGAADERVPVAAARATIRAFAERGGTATLTEFPHVGHLVTVAVVRSLQKKVAELAAPAS
jgi:phospholipase/carboxylesterase